MIGTTSSNRATPVSTLVQYETTPYSIFTSHAQFEPPAREGLQKTEIYIYVCMYVYIYIIFICMYISLYNSILCVSIEDRERERERERERVRKPEKQPSMEPQGPCPP